MFRFDGIIGNSELYLSKAQFERVSSYQYEAKLVEFLITLMYGGMQALWSLARDQFKLKSMLIDLSKLCF